MIRWAVSIGLATACVFVGVANAAAPVPKPKPIRGASLDPQAAIAELMTGGQTRLGPNVAAYAPATGSADITTQSGDVALYLVGKLSDGGTPVSAGLIWRVFGEIPDETGALPLIKKAEGGDQDLRLDPGRYVVHVSYGRAAVSRLVDLRRPVTSETFVLGAGGLQLDAVMEGDDRSLAHATSFEVFINEASSKRRIGVVDAGEIARLPAGSYHVISRYGDVNAVRSADVVVKAGKLTRVSLRHKAGTVRLRLVRNHGGEAIADTAWSIYTDDGKRVFERVGAHANVTLEAGRYAVVAKHRDSEFSQTFDVGSGEEMDVTVLARRLF